MQEWYYVVDGKQQGPVSKLELINVISSKKLPPETLVWTSEMTEWMKANKVDELVPEPTEAIDESIEVSESIEEPPPDLDSEMFLYIPISRLIFMSIISCGVYEVYWIYTNWKYLKNRDNLKIKPFWRAWFGLFFCHSLLREIHQDKELNKYEKPEFSPGTFATLWVALIIISNALNRVEAILAASLTFTQAFLCFIPVQIYINRANAKRNPNAPYTKWTNGHVICVGLGLLTWISTFMLIFQQ